MGKLKHPKAKGTRLEKEVVKIFKENNFEASRMWGSNGASRGLSEEVDVEVLLADENVLSDVEPFYIQCKSVKKLSQKYKPSDKVHAQVYKENKGKIYICMELQEFIRRLY